MGAPIIHQDLSGLAQGITQAGGALGQALGYRMQQQRQSQGLGAFQTALGEAEGSPESIAQAYAQALSSGADPAQLQALQQNYQSARKQNAFKTANDAAMDVGGISTPEGQNAFLNAYSESGGDPFEAMKYFNKDKQGQTVFDKKIDEFKAQSVIDYMKGGDQGDLFTENLDYLEKNIPDVGRQKAISGLEFGPLRGEKFTEYQNRGNLVLDGVIRVFNKAGVLPQKKLEWIRKTFAISPYDTQAQIQGKINSLRTLAKDANSFNKGMGGLIDKYGQNIPTSEFIKLQRNADKTFRKFDDQIASPQQERTVKKLQNKGYEAGDLATDTKTGQKLIFNGSRWVTQKK